MHTNVTLVYNMDKLCRVQSSGNLLLKRNGHQMQKDFNYTENKPGKCIRLYSRKKTFLIHSTPIHPIFY